jgi:hypothetical protein
VPLVDLTAPAPAADTRPRRLPVTLAELDALAELLEHLPLPVRAAAPVGGRLQDRMEGGARVPDATEPADVRNSLRDKGLTVGSTDDQPDDVPPAVRASLAALALGTPRIELRAVVDRGGTPVPLTAWFGVLGPVATGLGTVDGRTFELSFFGVEHLRAELVRALPAPVGGEPAPRLPAGGLRLPWEALTAATEAGERGRGELVQRLAQRVAAERPDLGLGAADVVRALGEVRAALRGRLRATVTGGRPPAEGTGAAETPGVGVLSWLLLGDRWHALAPVREPGRRDVLLRPVAAEDLPAQVAELVAEVR